MSRDNHPVWEGLSIRWGSTLQNTWNCSNCIIRPIMELHPTYAKPMTFSKGIPSVYILFAVAPSFAESLSLNTLTKSKNFDFSLLILSSKYRPHIHNVLTVPTSVISLMIILKLVFVRSFISSSLWFCPITWENVWRRRRKMVYGIIITIWIYQHGQRIRKYLNFQTFLFWQCITIFLDVLKFFLTLYEKKFKLPYFFIVCIHPSADRTHCRITECPQPHPYVLYYQLNSPRLVLHCKFQHFSRVMAKDILCQLIFLHLYPLCFYFL